MANSFLFAGVLFVVAGKTVGNMTSIKGVRLGDNSVYDIQFDSRRSSIDIALELCDHEKNNRAYDSEVDLYICLAKMGTQLIPYENEYSENQSMYQYYSLRNEVFDLVMNFSQSSLITAIKICEEYNNSFYLKSSALYECVHKVALQLYLTRRNKITGKAFGEDLVFFGQSGIILPKSITIIDESEYYCVNCTGASFAKSIVSTQEFCRGKSECLSDEKAIDLKISENYDLMRRDMHQLIRIIQMNIFKHGSEACRSRYLGRAVAPCDIRIY